ncbi:MAG: thioredoxin family protein [Alphaproteobacteria bacterium]
MKIRHLSCAMWAAALFVLSPVAQAQEGAVAELLASHTQAPAGHAMLLGLLIKPAEGWHIYAENPGDTGYANQVTWNLPAGASIASATYPVPHKIITQDIVNYGYSAPALITYPFTLPATTQAGETLNVTASVDYLVCKDVCIPLQTQLNAMIAVGDSVKNSYFNQSISAQIYAQKTLQIAGSIAPEHIVLPLPAGMAQAAFIPAEEGQIADNSPQEVRNNSLYIQRDTWKDTPIPTLHGLLKVGAETYRVSATLTPQNALPIKDLGYTGLAVLLPLMFAFLAGVLLNVMPCVLPVLSLKIMGLFKQSRGKALPQALAYTAGILASFWALGVVLLALRAAGQHVGWGFHLQSPVFVGILVVLLTLGALGFFGVIPLPRGLDDTEQKASKHKYLGAFLSGALVTMVATPCTVPFMAPAMAFALSASKPLMFMTFSALALGLASPFLLVAVFPKLLKRLPKPGAWMEAFKQFMGFPLLLTAVWLLNVFASLTNSATAMILLALLVILGLIAWLFQHHCTKAARFGLLLLIACFVWVILPQQSAHTPWSSAAVQAALAQGHPVLVNATADWCLTCKVVEKAVLQSDSFATLAQKHHLVLLTADWTRRDDAITAFLEHFGRQGVPLYVLYRPSAEPVVLPQLLTVADIAKHLP